MPNPTQTRESRIKPRIKENIPVQWWVPNKDFIAQGRIKNLSVSGFLLETDKVFRSDDNSTMQVQPLTPFSGDYLPEVGRIRWHRLRGNHSEYGVEFNQIPPQKASSLEKRVEKVMSQSVKNEKTINVVGVILTVLMIGLTGYVLYLQNENYQTVSISNDHLQVSSIQQAQNYRTYVHQYQVTKVALDETTAKLEQAQLALNQVTTELNSTRDLLAQTQTQLSDAQSENLKLKDQLVSLGVVAGTEESKEISNELSSLKTENEKYTAEIDDLKAELKAFNVDASNMQEAKAVLELFRSKIDMIKAKMKQFNREVYVAKVNAQKERDRIETLAGNGGFAVKDGEMVLINNKAKPSFGVDVKIIQ